MNFNKPKREGYMLTLWNNLIPNKGYTRLEIETLIQQANLPSSTFSNFRDYGVKQGYAILDDKTDLYYRSDSVLPSQQPQTSQDAEIDVNYIAQFIQKTVEQLKLAKQSQQNITQKKQLLEQEKQQLEIQEAELATKINELEQNLEPFRSISSATT